MCPMSYLFSSLKLLEQIVLNSETSFRHSPTFSYRKITNYTLLNHFQGTDEYSKEKKNSITKTEKEDTTLTVPSNNKNKGSRNSSQNSRRCMSKAPFHSFIVSASLPSQGKEADNSMMYY